MEPKLFEQAFGAHHAVLFPAFVSFVNRVKKEGGGAPPALEAASEKVARTHDACAFPAKSDPLGKALVTFPRGINIRDDSWMEERGV